MKRPTGVRAARLERARSSNGSPRGKRIVSALEQVDEDVTGRRVLPRRRIAIPEKVDVQAIRERLAMSQVEFAEAYGFSIATLRNWEQHRREPDGAARVLLAVIDRAPEAVRRALAPSNRTPLREARRPTLRPSRSRRA